MFGGVILWLVLSILIGVWASKLGREGIVWGLVAAFISPLLAAICLLVMGNLNDEESTKGSKSNVTVSEEQDKEWEVVKKYVPEVNSALETIFGQLDNQGILSAENKLKELFFVIGKEGLTKDALDIIVADVKKEIQDLKDKEEQRLSSNDPEKITVNMALVAELKGKVKTGFSPKFSFCEICNLSETGQTVNGHYVCGKCKQTYL